MNTETNAGLAIERVEVHGVAVPLQWDERGFRSAKRSGAIDLPPGASLEVTLDEDKLVRYCYT